MPEGLSDKDMQALRRSLQRLVYGNRKTFSRTCRHSGRVPLLDEGWQQELADKLSSVERDLYRETGREVHLY